MHTRTNTALRLAALLAAATLALTGCGSTAPASGADASATAGEITISDPWVKAADSGMTAGFGEVINGTDAEIVVVSATTDASESLELHETVEDETGAMTMREVADGFTIAAGTTLTLAPGGNHLMLMGLTAPLQAGDEVTFTLEFSDASTLEFTAPVKDYAGANERYGSDDHEAHEDH